MAVTNLDPQSLLTQAQQQARQVDWAQVTYSLQRLVNGEGHLMATDVHQLSSTDRAQWLNLAMQVLEYGDFQLRWDIGKLLPAFELEAMTALLELLSDDALDPDVQWFVIRALADFPHPEVMPMLLSIIQTSPQPELQQAAANALAQMGAKVIPILDALLQDAESRSLAVQILAQTRHQDAIPLLLELARDQEAATRAVAIDALSAFHSPQIAQVLLSALHDYASVVRLSAIRNVGFCLADLPDIDWLPYLQPLLGDLDLEVSRQAALTLGKLGTLAAIKTLAAILRSPHTPEPLAIDVIRALCWMERQAAIVELGQIWDDVALSEPVRQVLCQNLGRIESEAVRPQAVKLLMTWLANDLAVADSAILCQTIITALGLLGDRQAVDLLVQRLAMMEPWLQLHLVTALKQIDAPLARTRLTQISRLYPQDRALAAVVAAVLAEWS